MGGPVRTFPLEARPGPVSLRTEERCGLTGTFYVPAVPTRLQRNNSRSALFCSQCLVQMNRTRI